MTAPLGRLRNGRYSSVAQMACLTSDYLVDYLDYSFEFDAQIETLRQEIAGAGTINGGALAEIAITLPSHQR